MKTVLLVDDIPEYLDTMEINLPEGCQAVRGMSQDDARGLVAEKAPDAAVVDVRLKEGDAELAELTKNDGGFRVPRIEWELTAKRVLTSDWIDAIPMRDPEALKAACSRRRI